MEQTREKVIEELKASNSEFMKLWEEHQALEQQLAELDAKRALTPTDELEIKRLKKVKLVGKDKMEEFIHAAIPAAS